MDYFSLVLTFEVQCQNLHILTYLLNIVSSNQGIRLDNEVALLLKNCACPKCSRHCLLKNAYAINSTSQDIRCAVGVHFNICLEFYQTQVPKITLFTTIFKCVMVCYCTGIPQKDKTCVRKWSLNVEDNLPVQEISLLGKILFPMSQTDLEFVQQILVTPILFS